MALAGNKTVVKVGTTSTGPFNKIQGINDASHSVEGSVQDVTSFDATWVKQIMGLRSGSFSLSGFYEGADATGQKVIRDALINGTTIFLQILPDGTTGFAQEVLVSSFEVGASVDGTVTVSISAEGVGAVTAV